jgi:hypothetical protein
VRWLTSDDDDFVFDAVEITVGDLEAGHGGSKIV